MGALRTYLLLGLLMAPLPALADGLVREIAQCTGRMSAEMEFAWLTGSSGEQERLYRSHLEDVLEAITEPDHARDVLHLRIEAKQAHANLLTRATFNANKRDAAIAARIAAHYTASCRAMLTG